MNRTKNQSFQRLVLPLALAASVTVSSLPMTALAGPGDVNSVNNGQIIQSGTYYNTPGNKTTFTNSNGGGLWLKSGSTVRGLESDLSGNPTGNGGWLHFYAPGSVVRLDGNVNVNALMGRSGHYLGNGGRVTVDSAFLYQNGSIFANGVNGGMVQFNVGSAMFGPNSRIEAMGFGNGYGRGGYGGQVSVNSPGVVDIQRGAVMDTSGRVIGTYDTNVINIEGGLINMQGILRADGAVIDGQGSRGGTVRLVATGMSDVDCIDCAVSKVTDSTLDVVTLDGDESSEDTVAALEVSGNIFTAEDRAQILDRQNNLVDQMDGDIRIGGERISSPPPYPGDGDGDGDYDYGEPDTAVAFVGDGDGDGDGDAVNDALISANGTDGFPRRVRQGDGDGDGDGDTAYPQNLGDGDSDIGDGDGDYARNIDGQDGGTIILAAADDIENNGTVRANGGNGFSGLYDAGNGGDGGTISFTAGDDIINNAWIMANGGNGANSINSDYDYDSGQHAYAQAGQGQQVQLFGDGDGDQQTPSPHPQFNSMDGGDGGEGGVIAFSYGGDMENNAGLVNELPGLLVGPGTSGVIQANGGNGGNGANATAEANASTPVIVGDGDGDGDGDFAEPDTLTVDVGGVSASASATGGNGGRGGNGGLVVFSGPSNPTGHGSVEAIGGDGGRGGDATAIANATNTGYGPTSATANAFGGRGGDAGEAGLIVAPDPGTFGDHQYYQSTSGVRGADGTATAIATARDYTETAIPAVTSGDGDGDGDSDFIAANATANAHTGYHGESSATATAESTNNGANAQSTATSGDYGQSSAISDADANKTAIAGANATSGEHGFAGASADALSQNGNADADASAETGNNGFSDADAVAQTNANSIYEGHWERRRRGFRWINVWVVDRDVQHTADANATALTGDNGTALADATGTGTNESGIANAGATSGFEGYSRANSTANAGDDRASAESTANATSGRRGYSEANSTGNSADDVVVSSTATSGRGGTALAFGTANAGPSSADDVFSLTVEARTGRNGDSKAKGIANAGNDIDGANVEAHSGKNGRSWASLESNADDDIKDTHVLAKTGENGEAFASNTANAGDDIRNMSSTAEAGLEGTAVAVGNATADKIGDYSEGDRGLDVHAKAGRRGEAKALGIATARSGFNHDVEHVEVGAQTGRGGYAQAEGRVTADDDVDRVDVNAQTGRNGTALAHATVNAGDDIDQVNANATTGNNGRSEASVNATTGGGETDDVNNAIATATTGNNGTAIAVSHATGGDDITAVANATAGNNGFASADAQATSTSDRGGRWIRVRRGFRWVSVWVADDHDATATANATAGDNGSARSNAVATSNDDAYANATSNVGPGGGAHATFEITGGDEVIANAEINRDGFSASSGHTEYVESGDPLVTHAGGLWFTDPGAVPLGTLTDLMDHPEIGMAARREAPVFNPIWPEFREGNDIDQLQPTELILHNENAILLHTSPFIGNQAIPNGFGFGGGGPTPIIYLSDALKFANVRRLDNKYGSTDWIGTHSVPYFGTHFNYNASNFTNFVIGNTSPATLVLDQPAIFNMGYDIATASVPTCLGDCAPSPIPYQITENRFDNLNTLTVVSQGDLVNPADNTEPIFNQQIPNTLPGSLPGSIFVNRPVIGGWEVGLNRYNKRSPFNAAGGHISLIALGGSVVNNNLMRTYGDKSGGSINIKATGYGFLGRHSGAGQALFASGLFNDYYEEGGGLVEFLAMIAPDGIYNFDNLATSARGKRGDHGGSLIARGSNVINLGRIAANGRDAGGKIQLVASEMPFEDFYFDKQFDRVPTSLPGDYGESGRLFGLFDVEQWTGMPWTGHIINGGKVVANANGNVRVPRRIRTVRRRKIARSERRSLTPFGEAFDGHGTGGVIEMKADGLNINFGKVRADGKVRRGVGYGGHIWQHAKGAAFNFGLLQANGNSNGYGGQVFLTAGDKDHSNDDFNLFGLPDLVLGSSFLGLPPGVNLTRREAGYNFGTINATGGVQDGIAVLAGNNQFYQGGDINAGRTLLFVGQDIGGLTAVELAACVKIPDEELTPEGVEINPNLLGLFQEERFIPNSNLNLAFKLQLAFDQPELFLASNYIPVTEEILALAFEAYERELLKGESEERARDFVAEYLEQVGIDAEVAQSLIDRIDQGMIQATDVVVDVLQTIADGGEAPSDGLVQ